MSLASTSSSTLVDMSDLNLRFSRTVPFESREDQNSPWWVRGYVLRSSVGRREVLLGSALVFLDEVFDLVLQTAASFEIALVRLGLEAEVGHSDLVAFGAVQRDHVRVHEQPVRAHLGFVDRDARLEQVLVAERRRRVVGSEVLG